ncbi:helix-turn-helix domain-containing protein [Bizionia sp. KMM 8389]
MTYCFTYLCKHTVFGVLLVFLCIPSIAHAQKNDLILKAKELVYSDPDEAIKIGEHILKTSTNPSNNLISNIIIAKSYLVKGDYEKVVSYAFDPANNNPNLLAKTRIEVELLRADVLRKLYLDDQSKKYLKRASDLLPTYSNTAIHDSLKIQINLEEINMLIDRRKSEEGLAAIHELETEFDSFLSNNLEEQREIYLAKERAYSYLSKFDSAFVYMNKSLNLLDKTISNNLYKKAEIYKELGGLYLQQKAFKASEESFFIALKFSEIINNPILQMQINRDLAINYLGTNQKSQHQVYNDEFLILNNLVEINEQNAINTGFNMTSNFNEIRIEQAHKKYNNAIYILLGVAVIAFIIGILIILKSEGRKKRLHEIINYLEVSRTNFIKAKPSKKQATKRITIPVETEKVILQKLKRFETSQKFLYKDMSLAVLAGNFETNTKYLSEIINRHYDDNFNTFINKLRINYIIEKLKSDPTYMNYKISFLAEESGFSSHSSFATVFKAIIGMPPATFINLLKKERDELKKTTDA